MDYLLNVVFRVMSAINVSSDLFALRTVECG